MHDSLGLPPISDERWRDALQQIINEPARLQLHAQPIIELITGQVAGYELLSRFHATLVAPPDQWFLAADHWGFNAALQARVLTGGLAARSTLPPNTFLTVNLDPHLLDRSEISDVLLAQSDLSRLVLELTEHTQLTSGAGSPVLQHVRDAGGLVAMDDAGTGYAGLVNLLCLRPDIVKLDRELITGIDQDPIKRALVEVFGDLAGRMDAWILAEGIETHEELDALIGLGVPLGQGYLLARPQPEMITALPDQTAGHIRRTAARTSLRAHVASLIRPATVGVDPVTSDVILTGDGRASSVRTVDVATGQRSPAMSVAPSAGLVEVARRAMAREKAHRFAPLVCTDGQGAVLGVVRIDDLLLATCDLRDGVIT